MRVKLLDAGEERIFAVVFSTGANVPQGLMRFAREHAVVGAGFTAIGAFEEATLGFFEPGRPGYREIPISEQVEVLVLTGTIGTQDGEPVVHAHAVVGLRDGGHRRC